MKLRRRTRRRLAIVGITASVAAALAATAGIVGAATSGPSDEERLAIEAFNANAKPPALAAAEDLTTAAFLGDSYTHGTGASSIDTRWVNLVSRAKGWDTVALGRGGTGYLTTAGMDACGMSFCQNYGQMLPTAVAAEPDVLVIAGGQNDLRKAMADPAPVLAAVAKTYEAARASLPKATIIAVGPSTPAEIDATVIALDDAVQSAAAKVGAKYVSLIEPDVLDRATMMAPDGGHVNDAGHKAIAERVISALR